MNLSFSDSVAVQLRSSKPNPLGGMALQSSGSGFWGPPHEPRRIYTNAHVVHGAQTLSLHVPFDAHTPYPVRLVKICPEHDLAVLELPVPAYVELMKTFRQHFGEKCPGPIRLSWGDSAKIVQNAHTHLKKTQRVVAVGFPFGFPSAHQTHGSISASEIHPSPHQTYIAVDCAINPGNSGGPNIALSKEETSIDDWETSAGKILGINSAKISQADNEGFVIPIERVKWLNHATKTDVEKAYDNTMEQLQPVFGYVKSDVLLMSLAEEHRKSWVEKVTTALQDEQHMWKKIVDTQCFDGCAFLSVAPLLNIMYPKTASSIKILTVAQHMTQLPTTQLVYIPHFGVHLQKTTPATLAFYSKTPPTGCASGVVLTQVLKKTIAFDAGLQQHDFLWGLQCGDSPLMPVDWFGEVGTPCKKIPLSNALHKTRVGTPLTFHVLRRSSDGQSKELRLHASTRLPLFSEIHEGVRKMENVMYEANQGLQQISVEGIAVCPLTYELVGAFLKMGKSQLLKYAQPEHRHESVLVIKGVSPGSMASVYSNIEPGMIVNKVNGGSVKTFKEFIVATKQSESIKTWSLTTSCGRLFVCNV